VPARLLAAPSGWLVDHIQWTRFFLLATVICLPSLVLLLWLDRRFGVETAEAVAPVRAR